MKKLIKTSLLLSCFFALTAFADTTVNMHLVAPKGQGKSIGTITATDTQYGLLLTPNLSGLTPGLHGFHVHVNASCEDNGMAAGGHLDPNKTGKHLGPYNSDGHLGDMPPLYIDKDGKATLPVLAPRLKLADIKDHSLMIHAGGDNYADNPPMGGGGARVACGVVR
jgi:Cu-Zn family superoxide dismutase